jgi:hypothetical protein
MNAPAKHAMRYLEKVQTLQNRYPIYKVLDNFGSLAVGSSRSFVSVLQFHERPSNDGSNPNEFFVEEVPLSNLQLLRTHLGKAPVVTLRGSLYLCEDPSLEFIEALGEKLNVDPAAVATYLFTPDRSMTKESKVARNLPSRHANSQTFTLKYHEVRDLPSKAPMATEYVNMAALV